MGYDLQARNKNIEDHTVGAFTWSIMLQESGAGYIIGYGKGVIPGTYVYHSENQNGTPNSNDGYKITAKEAKMISYVVYGYVAVCRFNNKTWEGFTEEEKIERKERTMYVQPVDEGWLKKVEKFAEFADKSGGFRIY